MQNATPTFDKRSGVALGIPCIPAPAHVASTWSTWLDCLHGSGSEKNSGFLAELPSGTMVGASPPGYRGFGISEYPTTTRGATDDSKQWHAACTMHQWRRGSNMEMLVTASVFVTSAIGAIAAARGMLSGVLYLMTVPVTSKSQNPSRR